MRIRPATETDIQSICDLVNHFANQNLMLHRTAAQVQLALGDLLVVDQDQVVVNQDKLVGCGFIAYLSPTLVEIRSLAVDASQQGKGLGGRLVDALASMAQMRGVRQICALTLTPDFFFRQGFHRVDRWSISPKIWSECVYCPKFHACDEIAVMRELKIDD